MSGQTLTLLADQNTDAQFRAWGSAISAALATQGLVQTADTGQINWTTVLTPSATSQSRGYEIWRFNDTLQSSAPVFLKIEYGSGTGSQRQPQMWVTAGTGSDGAGNLTGTNITGVYGAITTRRAIGPVSTATNPAATSNVYINGNSGCISILAWPCVNAFWGGFFLLVERWRNWDGTNSGDGVTVFTAAADSTSSNNSSQSLCFVPNLAVNPGGSSSIGQNVPGSGMNLLAAAVGTTLYPLPVFTGPGPRSGAPSQFVLAMGIGDYPSLASFTMSHYGTSQTWLSAGIGAANVPGWSVWSGSGNIKSFLFRTS